MLSPDQSPHRPWHLTAALASWALAFTLIALVVGSTGDHLGLVARIALVTGASLLAIIATWGALRAQHQGLEAETATDLGQREAVRTSQKIARQLHQLIAASIAVAGLRSESDVLARLARSVRSVFDADTAVVALEQGPASPLCIVADRASSALSTTTSGPTMLAGLHLQGLVEPVREGTWLVAPMLVRRGESRGVVAVSRPRTQAFSDDDVEVLRLIAQMASSSLDASEMNRTILNSEERWRVLVETAPVGIVETDLAGGIRWWNRAAGTLFAWPRYEVHEDSDPPVFPRDAMGELTALWSEVMAGAAVAERDLAGIELAGERRDLTASAAILTPSSDGARSILTLVDDVTDHLQLMEELRHAQRMEVIGQLSSSVAHDFNNLLTLISGYAELLAQHVGDDERARQLTEDIQATTTRASTLTGKLLTMGRTKTPSPVVFSPAGVIGSIAEVLDRIIGAGIGLTLTLEDDAGNVRADADQFEQMILNLATNARDAMPRGGQLRISLEGTTLDHPEASELGLSAGPYVRIEVGDTGEGMDEETQRRCFEPLFTTKGPSKGTGLGLPAARRVVTESDGSIQCHSALGRGTTFEILLPVVDEVATQALEPRPEDRMEESGTVLLAEDEEGIRLLVSRVLTRCGFEVLEAESAEQAIQVAEASPVPIDLLVSDVVMAGMTGRELAGILQSDRPDLLIVLMSGNVDKTALEDLTPGTAAFLSKPFRPSELLEVVRELRRSAALDRS